MDNDKIFSAFLYFRGSNYDILTRYFLEDLFHFPTNIKATEWKKGPYTYIKINGETRKYLL